MPYLDLIKSNKARRLLTETQARTISRMYSDIVSDIDKELLSLSTNTNASVGLKRMQLKQLQKALKDEIAKVGKQIERMILGNVGN
jgi:hypothetical protein